MRDDRVNQASCEKRFCTCKELQPCACINYPPYHCGVCGGEYLPEQLAEAKRRGWYTDANKSVG